MKNILTVIVVMLFITIIGLLSYGAWTIGRKFSYKNLVIQTIKENVKEDCLKK